MRSCRREHWWTLRWGLLCFWPVEQTWKSAEVCSGWPACCGMACRPRQEVCRQNYYHSTMKPNPQAELAAGVAQVG